MVRAEALPLSGDAGIGDIRDMIAADRLPPPAATPGTLTSRDVMAPYVEKVMSFIDVSTVRPFTVVLDAGSGMAGMVAPRLFDRLPCKTTRLCFEVDGTFPNHEANPLIEENRQDITAEVIRQHADIGIAWDGDADRCFFIDGSGEFISGDFVTALLAEAFLLKHPGSTVIYDLRASWAVRDTVAKYGGRSLMNRVGHAFIKQRMRQEDGIFAGEVTGHYYFRDFYYADNGFIPALLILELMSKKGQTLRDLLQPYRERYFISGEINTKLASMSEVPATLAAIKARYQGTGAAIAEIDGVSVDYADWHFNVRASNTEPLIRLNLESITSPAHMAEKRDEVLGIIRG
jgi:phosphomannomutase